MESKQKFKSKKKTQKLKQLVFSTPLDGSTPHFVVFVSYTKKKLLHLEIMSYDYPHYVTLEININKNLIRLDYENNGEEDYYCKLNVEAIDVIDKIDENTMSNWINYFNWIHEIASEIDVNVDEPYTLDEEEHEVHLNEFKNIIYEILNKVRGSTWLFDVIQYLRGIIAEIDILEVEVNE